MISTKSIKSVSKVVAYAFGALFFVITVLSCSKDENDVKIPGIAENKNKNLTSVYPEASRLEFPRLKGGSSLVLIHKTNDKYGVNFSTEWDCTKKSQRWSCYQMHAGNTGGNVGRYQEGYPYDDLLDHTNYFNNNGEPYDPFWSSGYDHGHICPSADRQYSKEANRQTFFLTNMQPQRNTFNAGVWAAMEQQVRNWNRGNFRDTLYVCKGGTIDKSEYIIEYVNRNSHQSTRVNENHIPVPRFFYMALVSRKGNVWHGMAYWVQQYNEDHSNDNRKGYAISIDRLEELTGIDFFCNLPDDIEDQVESEKEYSFWGLQ